MIRTPICALALAIAFAGRASAAIDDQPAGLIASSTSLAKVRALYLKYHDRERTRAATIIEEWRLTQDKMNGTYHVFRLGRDERDLTILGPFFSESGVHAGTRWQQTRNGMTYTYAGVHELRDARSDNAWLFDPDPHDVRLIGESVPLNAYVIEIDPPGGRHEWRWLDKSSANVVRREYVEKGRRYTVTFDDYRTFDGIPEPSHVRTVDSYGNERNLTLLSRTLDLTPDPHDVDIPSSRRTLVEFPTGVTSMHLPSRMVDGLCVVKVRIGLKDYDFLLDSGAAGIVIDPSIVDDAHLETYGSRIGETVGTFNETTGIVPLMTIGGLRMRSVVARVVAVPFHLDDRTHIAGLLGFDFFLDAVVHVDLDHGTANAIAAAAFKPPPDAATVPIALDDRTPVVRARADAVTGRVVLDTGANRSVFTPPFASRADIAFDPSTAVAQFRGLGGMGTATTVRLKSFDIAALPLLDPVVDVSNANLGAEDIDGTAGTDLLHAYDLFFDYRNAALYVRRSKKA
ncbi:MAG TPA: aspartyl protease family protein [Candidatus Lustribacter sp.]|nr:aspartyl protease family protein [Candidatus Lustribacter sp.]